MRAALVAALLALAACQAAPHTPAGLAAPAGSANCAPREQLLAGLVERYGEHLVARGLTPGGALFEIHAAAGGSFTVLLSGPADYSCLILAGQAWQLVPPPPVGDPT